ncbi:MAG: serine/threonine-protein kinase [Hyphomicrobiaceae bacterium]|nr:serine/threonine-protein kinase [Hyphomicrobiaceae bacterium]
MTADKASIGTGGLLESSGQSTPATVGKYRIDGIIGRGAIGVVYRGFDPDIERIVAIKTLRREVLSSVEDQRGLLQRFASEARSAGRCQHPNIVTVFDYVEQEGTPYIVMEYVDAGTLENVTRSGTLLPVSQVCEIMMQLLSALGHAHEKGVVHRDVKPANILCPAATSIKVTDFGVARFQDLGLTQAGSSALGTPNYMSPEQFLGREVDGRSDLFAAGIILFQLLTGTKPFIAADIPELMRKLLNNSPPALSSLRPELAQPFDDVVQKALARNPTDRYETADAFSAALVGALERATSLGGKLTEAQSIDLTRLSLRPTPELTDSSRGGLNRTMAEKLTPATLGHLEETLARSIGPIARLVLARASRETTDADKLLARLAAQIPGAEEAQRFRKAAERWLRDDQGIAAAQLDAVVSEAEVREATELLLPLIGPVARILAEREAKTAIGREDYYEHLARAIGNEADRARFLARGTRSAGEPKRK